MRIDLNETAEFLLNNDNFLLLCHSSPDGDTVGSATALASGLISKGKKVDIKCGDKIGKDFDFMFEGLELTEAEEYDHIVAVDVADPKLLGLEFEYQYGSDIELCIDHHASNVMYAEKIWLESDSASVAEMIYLLLGNMKVEITPIIASCLFTGVSTDTGCFRFSNTTVRTFRIASELVDAGADSYNIIQVFLKQRQRHMPPLKSWHWTV